ncbi:MAG: DUF4142 domain-containing protein [Rhizobacter sp.]|nr:DUF4142 domain-containing protein [Bacteriovorax sp.]
MKTKIWLLSLALSIGTFAAVSTHAADATTLNDQQIAEILEKTNDAEIDAAKLAKGDAKNKEVKEFAKMMIDEHKMNNKEAKMVLKKGKIKPEETETSKMITEESKSKRELLKKQKNLAFDKMYMEQQVAMHTQVLSDLETKLIPSAKNAALKTHLEATKVHVKAHLEKAQAIQAKL